MAKMYPKNIDFIRKLRQDAGQPIDGDQGFDGEMRIFRELEKLPNNWTVIYSCWLKDRESHINTEADFVVLVPDKGIIALEVKTRALRIVDGQWRDVNGNFLSRSPAQQAFLASKHIAEYLNKRGIINCGSSPFVEYTHLAILNTIHRPVENLRDKESYVFEEDIPDLRQRIEQSFTLGSGFSPITINKVRETLLETYRFKQSPAMMTNLIETEAARISALLPMLHQSPNGVWVEGCAGSGKTVIAVNEIVRLTQEAQAEKPRILYTCYSVKLRKRIEAELKERLPKNHQVSVMGFFELISAIRGKRGFMRDSDGCILDEHCDEILDVIKTDPKWKFDYIFVDEAQDHGSDFQRWDILAAMLNQPQHKYQHLYAFADANQMLFNGLADRRNDTPDFGVHVRLRSNLRNPGNIGRCAALAFDEEPHLSYLNFSGTIVLKEGSDDASERAATVDAIVSDLINNYDVEASEIIILSPLAVEHTGEGRDHNRDQRSLRILHDSYGYLAEEDAASDGMQQLFTIKKFKGLEAPFIIATDIPGKASKPEWGYLADDFYVACTRAKVALYLVPTLAGYDELKELVRPLAAEGEAYH